jgi:flagellar biosynthetic protein FlhB
MADKTEKPTARRLEDAREDGQVVYSVELNAAAAMLVGTLLIMGPAKSLSQNLGSTLKQLIIDLPKADLTELFLLKLAYSMASSVLPPFMVILFGLLVTGVAISLAQTGFLWTTKKIGFDFKRINPLTGIKRIFSTHGLIELLRAALKLVVIGWVAYGYLKNNTAAIMAMAQYDLATATIKFFDLAMGLALQVGEIYLAVAAADYAYQRWEFMRNMRMSKEEIKEEYKRAEGNPFLKSRIRAQMRRMARGRMMSNVPKATVVVTNPTHLAIAIEYRKGMNAPKVLAKGAHYSAQRIVALAREHNIPVVQNIPLARAIFKRIEIDQEISPDLYLAMAEVLAYVYRLKGMIPRPTPVAQPVSENQAAPLSQAAD